MSDRLLFFTARAVLNPIVRLYLKHSASDANTPLICRALGPSCLRIRSKSLKIFDALLFLLWPMTFRISLIIAHFKLFEVGLEVIVLYYD